jgi:2-dehydro-3-deoxyphosphooctonate aldolase (KDO 8-P synthase)
MASDYTKCQLGPYTVGGDRLMLIAGPCMAESVELCLTVAKHMQAICADLGVDYVFKASFDKANRTSLSSYRGPGLEGGLAMLQAVASETGLPVMTDIHEPAQAAAVASVVDAMQIPAFLCRQTDLLVAAAKTGKCVNIKKGQFMAPDDMNQAVTKVRESGNDDVLLTERGASFGYNRLITDFRAIPQMQAFAPVIFDATHSVQEPAGQGTISGGRREFAPMLAGAAMAMGADGLFIETHTDPDNAKSDAACQIPLDDMAAVVARCLAIRTAAKG